MDDNETIIVRTALALGFLGLTFYYAPNAVVAALGIVAGILVPTRQIKAVAGVL